MESLFGDKKYELRVLDGQGLDGDSSDGDIRSGCLVFVYDAGTKTLSTIYGDGQRTALANPITRARFATDQAIKFFSGSSSHDILLAHSDGSKGVYSSVSSLAHSLNLDRSSPDKVLTVPFSANTAETDTGIDLPRYVAVMPPVVEVVTLEAAKTIDVGLLSTETGGDTNGFIVAASLAAATFVRPWVITDGANENFVSSTVLGELIGIGALGSDVNNDFGQPGGYAYITGATTAVSVVYQCSAGSAAAAGYIHIPFKHLR